MTTSATSSYYVTAARAELGRPRLWQDCSRNRKRQQHLTHAVKVEDLASD